MMNELRARLGEERYRTLMLTITDNLEAYAIARDAGLSASAWDTVLRIPEGELDDRTRELLTALLDHVVSEVTGEGGRADA